MYEQEANHCVRLLFILSTPLYYRVVLFEQMLVTVLIELI